MKFLKGCHLIYVIDGAELQIAVDISHEPWSLVAVKLLEFIKQEMDELGYEVLDVDYTIQLLKDDGSALQ
jgi:hypothetical protein